jgi:hypothetical protein
MCATVSGSEMLLGTTFLFDEMSKRKEFYDAYSNGQVLAGYEWLRVFASRGWRRRCVLPHQCGLFSERQVLRARGGAACRVRVRNQPKDRSRGRNPGDALGADHLTQARDGVRVTRMMLAMITPRIWTSRKQRSCAGDRAMQVYVASKAKHHAWRGALRALGAERATVQADAL